ncbi:hypothetical protein CVS40_3116 [Lucilia cuprina]|nr:hypothetical protein CVS40_3116 [Lucilia cuprina]
MSQTFGVYLTLILNLIILCCAQNCQDDPVKLDEQFIGCCRGRPKYTSELCIDTLLANDTFSEKCILDCMYKEFKIYDGEQIDLEAVNTFIDEQITDVNFNLIYMDAFESCSKFAKDTLQQKFSFVKYDNEHNCDDYAMFVDICVWYHTLGNCPEEYANNDDICHDKREWVNKCLFET